MASPETPPSAVSRRTELPTREYLAAIVTEHLATEERLKALLEDKFPNGPLAEVEYLLITSSTVAEPRLRTLKGMLWGLAPAPTFLAPTNFLPEAIAKAAGAIALGGDEPAVAFVDPSPTNKRRVAQALGSGDFKTYVVTVTRWRELYEIAYLSGKNYPRLESIEEVFAEAVRRNASDFHIKVGEAPGLRVDGFMVRMERAPIELSDVEEWFPALAGPERWEIYLAHNDADQAITYDKHRIRLNYGRDRKGPTLAGRFIPVAIPTPDQLHLPQPLRDFCELERGLVLVTGPTGSGKSTTLASLLNYMAINKPLHIITLEDPIEYFLTPEKAFVSQRERGGDFTDFATALRQALRQDPDVILVGELRDRETMRAALTAAETGHLVFATLHTYDAVATVNRYVNAFPADEHDQIRNQLAYLLEGVVSQTLVPRKQGGRVAAMEVMLKTPAIQANLRKADGLPQLRATIEISSKEGMQTLEQHLAHLVKQGVITRDDAYYKARRPESLKVLLEE